MLSSTGHPRGREIGTIMTEQLPGSGEQPEQQPWTQPGYGAQYPPPYPQAPYPYAYGPAPTPPPPTPGASGGRSWVRSPFFKYGAGAAAVVVACGLAFGAGTTVSHTRVVHVPAASNNGSSADNPFGSDPFGLNNGNGDGTGDGSSGSSGEGGSSGSGSGGFGFGGSGSSGSGSSGTATLPSASATQSVGVVDIDTNLKYQGAQAAGTGMVLDASGDILTNNHVIDGATTIKVTVVSTGKTYTAKVVGTDPTADIAVVRAVDASGLATANFGDSDSVKVGAAVTGVGNAGGTGGTPSAATGKVLALHQSITASDDGSNAEKLPDVIVSDAPIQAGDSGGPLYNAQNQVVGIDTAANTSGSSQAFSIPIDTARSLASQILAGNQTTAIHIGLPGFLGVSVGTSQAEAGTLVSGLVSGGPADQAGIVAGDRITKVNGSKTSTPTALTKVMATLDPGDRVSVTYVTSGGTTHVVTLTLATGPAD
jgi:S1-C subfamily serine protease